MDNFIHADMHPGNILVRELPSIISAKSLFKPRPHVIFLDVGMTAELSKKDRENLVEFFKAVALRDGRCAAECTLRLSNKQSCPYPEAFITVCSQPNFACFQLRLSSARTFKSNENDTVEIYINSSGGFPKAHEYRVGCNTKDYKI